MSPLLTTLGHLKLHGIQLTRPKQLLLLTYLCVEGATTREQLRSLFFGTHSGAAVGLRVALCQLRSSGLLAPNKGEHIQAPEFHTDVGAFLEDLRLGQDRAALALYKGPFLQGIHLNLTVELEEWVYTTREILANRAVEAAIRLGQHELCHGHPQETYQWWNWAVHCSKAVGHLRSGIQAEELLNALKYSMNTSDADLLSGLHLTYSAGAYHNINLQEMGQVAWYSCGPERLRATVQLRTRPDDSIAIIERYDSRQGNWIVLASMLRGEIPVYCVDDTTQAVASTLDELLRRLNQVPLNI